MSRAKTPHPQRKPKPIPLLSLRDQREVLLDSLSNHVYWSDSIESGEELIQSLQHCQKNGLRCIRIIHGKGLRSKNREPVLKNKVAHWLMQRDETLAFCQARAADGGGGAMLVLLRSL